MKKYSLGIVILLMVVVDHVSVFSQTAKDSVLLLNGDLIIGSITEIAMDHLTIDETGKKFKKKFIEKERIFSYSNASGEHILYVYDTTVGNDFTIPEMRYYIRGEQDAKNGFRARPAFYTGIIIGAAGGLTGTLFYPLPAFMFAALVGLPKIKIKKNSVRNLDDLNHLPYLVGYESMSRRNRKIQSLLGGAIGTVAGLGTFIILHASGRELFR